MLSELNLSRKMDAGAYRFENAQLNLHGPGVEAIPLAKFRFHRVAVTSVLNGPARSRRPFIISRCIAVAIELGPVRRSGARGDGISIYFRDPDGSLLEFISYHKEKIAS